MRKKYSRELTSKELAQIPDEDIDTSDIPELDDTFWDKARIVMPEDRMKSKSLQNLMPTWSIGSRNRGKVTKFA